MAAAYVERLVRFGVGLLVAAVLMAVIVRAVPGGLQGMAVSWQSQRPVDEVISEGLVRTWRTVGWGMGFGLPLALLLGIPAGLRVGSRLDRGLQGPVVALMGTPLFVLMLYAILHLTKPVSDPLAKGISLPLLVVELGALAVIWAAWMARAVRDGVAGVRMGGEPTGPRALRMAAAVTGRLLQQTGNLAAILMVAEVMGAGLPGVLQEAIYAGLYLRDVPVVIGALRTVVPAVLVAQLIGDLLVTYGEGEGRPPAPVSRGWLIAGAVMVTALVVVALLPGGEFGVVDMRNRLLPPGTPGHLLGTDPRGRDMLGLIATTARTSLTVVVIAQVIAAVGGGMLGAAAGALGRWGGVLSPRVAVPGLWTPIFVALCFLVMNGPGLMTTAVALGVASIPGMAMGFRWLVRQRSAGQGRAAVAGFVGVLVLVAAQILMAEAMLGYLGRAGHPPVLGLGALVGMNDTYLRLAPWFLYPALLTTLESAGLFLVGHALTDAAGTRIEGGMEVRQPGERAEA